LNFVAGIESRGFLFASALALKQGAGLIPIRKKGKLPRKTLAGDYTLEYGQDTMEIHEDAFSGAKGKSVLLVDDVLATGETARCAASLIEQAGGKVAGITVLIELTFLKGRTKLNRYPFHSVIQF
jgi:adenine phosphoribosyltransferase